MSRADKVKAIREDMAEMTSGISAAHDKMDEKYDTDFSGMQKMLEGVNAPLTAALSDMGHALKGVVTGRSDDEPLAKAIKERLVKVEEAIEEQRETNLSNSSKLDLILSKLSS